MDPFDSKVPSDSKADLEDEQSQIKGSRQVKCEKEGNLEEKPHVSHHREKKNEEKSPSSKHKKEQKPQSELLGTIRIMND